VEDRLRGREDVRPQLGVNAVRGDHHVGLHGRAVGKLHARDIRRLLETGRAMAGADDAGADFADGGLPWIPQMMP